MSDKKTYSFGSLDKSEDWKTIKMLDTKPDIYSDLLHDYQKQVQDKIFNDAIYGTNLCKEITIPHMGSNSVTHKATPVTATKASFPTSTMTYKDMQDLMNIYYNKGSWGADRYVYNPNIKPSDKALDVIMEDGSTETISRADLIKYIGERKIIRENEVVRKVYERYQVAVKLVRSDDNGDTGV